MNTFENELNSAVLPDGNLNIGHINAKISGESQTSKQPDEILEQVNDLSIEMFKDRS